VDPTEETALVSGGLFRWVRNPIFTSMLLLLAGLALIAPAAPSVASFFVALAGLELQVRLVEEPYVSRVHGEAYRAYAARVGRFLPCIGRLRDARRA
jgi:protein-S-isoprenylcysteine O-methyltransferase Ste14